MKKIFFVLILLGLLIFPITSEINAFFPYLFTLGNHCPSCVSGSETSDTYGVLSVALNSPIPGETTNVNQNQNFWVNSTIICEGLEGAVCGEVNGIVRYNTTNSTLYFADNGVSHPTYAILNYPPSVYYNGKTYVVWQGEDFSPDPYITYYDHSSNSWGDVVKIANNPLSNDDHGAPAVIVDNQGYLHVFYGSHNNAMRHAKSNNPEDISLWTTQGNPVSDSTYPSLVKNGDNMYVFYRIVQGNSVSQGSYYYIKSSNNGGSWGSENQIISKLDTGGIDYGVYAVLGELAGEEISMAWTYATSESGTPRKNIYHAYFNISDEHMYNVAGVDLGTTIDKSEADSYCKVRDSGNWYTQIPAIDTDSNSNPYLVWTEDSSTDYKIKFGRWNGSDWNVLDITTTDHKFNMHDLIAHSPTCVEAYLTTSGEEGRGGDIEKWTWDGSSWTNTPLLTEVSSGRPLNNPTISLNFNSELKVILQQINPNDYSATDLRIYAYSESGFVTKFTAGEISTIISTTTGETPFYTTNQPLSCGLMNQGDLCEISWNVNATGVVGDNYKINVRVTSNEANVSADETNNALVNISLFEPNNSSDLGGGSGGGSSGSGGGSGGDSSSLSNEGVNIIQTGSDDAEANQDLTIVLSPLSLEKNSFEWVTVWLLVLLVLEMSLVIFLKIKK